MNIPRALVAGVAGGLAMTALGWLGRSVFELKSDMEMMFGTMSGMMPGKSAWVLGFAIHLLGSGLIALIYASVFERITRRAGWLPGAVLGCVHAIVAGLAMGLIPAVHALIPEHMPAPGILALNMGATTAVFEIVQHVIYGAIVGALYGPVGSMRVRSRA